MRPSASLLLFVAVALLHVSDAAAIEAKRTDIDSEPDASLDHVYFPFGYPLPSLTSLESIPGSHCEYSCAPGDPHATKCKCTFKPPLTGCHAYGCDIAPSTSHDTADPDTCKACQDYARGCSLRSRLYCPRMICEGGDETVPRQCWLGGKCQKVSKDEYTYWCQSPTNFPKRDAEVNGPSQEDVNAASRNSGDSGDTDPNLGIVGPVIIIPPKVKPPPVVLMPTTKITALKQSLECGKCDAELDKCTKKALCDYKQPGQDYCLDGCKRFVCNFARPKCRDTCFKDECTRLNAVLRGIEYNGF